MSEQTCCDKNIGEQFTCGQLRVEIDRLKAELEEARQPPFADDCAALIYAERQIEQYKGCLQLLSSIWYHGDFVVETYNEAKLCELMKLLGFWPYKEKFKLEG